MIDFDRFTWLAALETRQLPEYVFEDLNLGVTVSTELVIHPAAVNGDLYVMGQYQVGKLGRGITLFYGSFVRSGFTRDENLCRQKIQEVVRHEFLHHLETKAGEFGKGSLIEYDWNQIEAYLREKKGRGGGWN